MTLSAAHSQDAHVVRLDWGPEAAGELTRYAVASGAAVTAVVVDVLSFTTSVSVAADAGVVVHPYRWDDDSAATIAEDLGATLAVPRSVAGARSSHDDPDAPRVSLSPGSIRAATRPAGPSGPTGPTGPTGLRELVLPSPNGSTISQSLADSGAEVVAASLRNRTAVAEWVVDRMRSATGRRPAVILMPAGERWTDGSLRPAVEDLWGAGAVIAALVARLEHQAGPLLLSPEAAAGLAAWLAVESDVRAALRASASGRELAERGWGDDVEIAAELDTSTAVPVLRDGAYRPV
jgi:2-phosphosulfolactate phosphatase